VRRLIYISTASVHGQAPEPGTTERSPVSDRQPIEYNNAKVQAERRLLRLHARGTVQLVLLRPGIVVGPRSYWVSSFADALLQREACLIDGGRGICNSIYVDNLVYAIQGAMTNPAADGEAFLLGDRELVTWADLYRPIATALGVDLASLPDAAVVPRRASLHDRLKSARESRMVRRVSTMLPKRIRRAFVAAISAPQKTVLRSSPWALPSPPERVATLEMALLYRCGYKLPFDKAAKILGYEPRVSFELVCRRTVAWLAFAGYAVSQRAQDPEASLPVDRWKAIRIEALGLGGSGSMMRVLGYNLEGCIPCR
jgi:nucleoside-diphosphate-sugar epimerase